MERRVYDKGTTQSSFKQTNKQTKGQPSLVSNLSVQGSETSRAGLAMLFEMLQVNGVFSYNINFIINKVFNIMILSQFPSLNKRLVIVILEGAIKTIFPDQDFTSVFLKLHSRSSR